jgi:hypothetical protein
MVSQQSLGGLLHYPFGQVAWLSLPIGVGDEDAGNFENRVPSLTISGSLGHFHEKRAGTASQSGEPSTEHDEPGLGKPGLAN